MIISRALPAEAELLSSLALRSKGHWRYAPELLEVYRDELKVWPEAVAEGWTFKGEVERRVVGFYVLSTDSARARLEFMFVQPAWIGRGLGRALWEHATARGRGWAELGLFADLHAAESFYGPRGCREVGRRETILGPLIDLRFALVAGS